MEIPASYLNEKIYTYSSNIRETSSYLNGCCPVCREGDSWNKKRRMFYFKHDNYIFCHNCFRSWTPYYWIKEVCDLSFNQILSELKESNYDPDFQLFVEKAEEKIFELPPLPGECVNLQDTLQIQYFKSYPIVNVAREYALNRRLFTARYAPKTLFCCLNDKFHKNRLIIPFYNNHKIESYISRKLLDYDTKAKYLIKFGSKKPIFNLDKIDPGYPYIFIFEGQIDAMFLKNGIAVSGVHLTIQQDETLTKLFPFHNRIWVLDNYRFENKEVTDIIIEKIKKREMVFLYDGEFSEFKDLNEYCIKKEQDFVDPALILNGSYSGDKGLLKLGN